MVTSLEVKYINKIQTNMLMYNIYYNKVQFSGLLSYSKRVSMLLSYSLTILCLLMLHFFRLPRFPSLLPVTSQGENDVLLVHNISSPAPTPILVPIKPLIT